MPIELNTGFADLVRVWRVNLAPNDLQLKLDCDLLSDDEQTRATRFAFSLHGKRFVACRAALRRILAKQLNMKPDELVFSYTPYGRPELDVPKSITCTFNVAHSADTALIAFRHSGGAIGIDIEYPNTSSIDIDNIIGHLHPDEQKELVILPVSQRVASFYRCWVRKEALLKALGLGLPGGFHRFVVNIDEPAQLLWVDPKLTHHNWELASLNGPGYVAALAIERRTKS